MLNLEERKKIVVEAGKMLAKVEDHPELAAICRKAEFENAWFTQETISKAIKSIVEKYTNEDKLDEWLSKYDMTEERTPKKLGLLLAGNIPFVGIHDVITGFIAGHHLQIKYSDKDAALMKMFVQLMVQQDERTQVYFTERERLNGLDMVIATGSNNSSRYFDYYFGKIPNVIRKNRTSVAVIGEETSMDELRVLSKDVFSFFGLGCRNVSKLYLPKGYKIESVMEAFENWKEIVLHNKYKNNFDYNYAIYLLNKVKFYTNGCIIAMEDDNIHSRISCLHFSYYENLEELGEELKGHKEDLQCVVSNVDIDGIKSFGFGKAQESELWEYADDVDSLQFLLDN